MVIKLTPMAKSETLQTADQSQIVVNETLICWPLERVHLGMSTTITMVFGELGVLKDINFES